MQTFLPYPSFADSARTLDRQRLGKQRSECIQILKGLTVPNYRWRHHTATKMWRGYKEALVGYGVAICDEWIARGYKDTCRDKILQFTTPEELFSMRVPSWLGVPALHASHRSNLLRKDPTHYGQFGWTEPHDLPYVWPNP